MLQKSISLKYEPASVTTTQRFLTQMESPIPPERRYANAQDWTVIEELLYHSR